MIYSQGSGSWRDRSGVLAWTLAGAALVVTLPWLQRWYYLWPEMDYRLFWGGTSWS